MPSTASIFSTTDTLIQQQQQQDNARLRQEVATLEHALCTADFLAVHLCAVTWTRHEEGESTSPAELHRVVGRLLRMLPLWMLNLRPGSVGQARA